jgi:hypothetical protein
MKKLLANLFGYLIFLPVYGVFVVVNYVTGEIIELMKEFDRVVSEKLK